MSHVKTPSPYTRGFTLVELMVVVAILGILAAIAIPTMTLYIRRAKTAEARVQLAKMFDSTAGFFGAEHVDRGEVEQIGAGGTLADLATHRCPHPIDTPEGGEAGLTPNINCNLGPGAKCIPALSPAGAGYYDMHLWGQNTVWNGLNFAQEQGHHYRYNFVASNALTGYGACQFTSSAFGDLDDDGVFSTFERSGAADINGVNAAAGLHIQLVVE